MRGSAGVWVWCLLLGRREEARRGDQALPEAGYIMGYIYSHMCGHIFIKQANTCLPLACISIIRDSQKPFRRNVPGTQRHKALLCALLTSTSHIHLVDVARSPTPGDPQTRARRPRAKLPRAFCVSCTHQKRLAFFVCFVGLPFFALNEDCALLLLLLFLPPPRSPFSLLS